MNSAGNERRQKAFGSGGWVKPCYFANGNLQAVSYPAIVGGVVVHSYAYNEVNGLTVASITTNGLAVASFNYNPNEPGRKLGAAGERRAVRESIGSVVRSVNYDYDALYRLTKEDLVRDDSGYGGTVNYPAYDAVGNRLSRTVSGGNLTAKVHGASNLSYGLNDWRNGDTYDARGNTLTGDWDGDGVNTQSQADEYDFENRLVRAVRGTKTISFTYDGDGNRVRKNVLDGSTTTVTRYLVDDRNPSGYAQVLEEWKSVDAGATFALDVSYVYGLGIVSQKRGAVTSYYGRDGHGSVRLLINGSTGSVTDTYHYDAFGILLSGTQPTSNNYRYTGEQWDEDLGMYYLRARYYQPQTGRFWTMDTFEGNNQDPLSLHKYLYCHGDPVNGTDPTGQFELTETMMTTWIETSLQVMNYGFRVYQAYGKLKNLIDYTRIAFKLIKSLQASTPQGVVGALSTSVQEAFGVSAIGALSAGMGDAMETLERYWGSASGAIAKKVPEMSSAAVLGIAPHRIRIANHA